MKVVLTFALLSVYVLLPEVIGGKFKHSINSTVLHCYCENVLLF